MTKLEEKLLDFLASHRILLAYVIVTALNLLLRKIAVWWSIDGIVGYYDGHDHMIQGQLWWLLMRIGIYLPVMPVHFMKWVSAAGDFAMAAVGALALTKGTGAGSKQTVSPEKGLVFYSVVLIMPFTLLRGIVWSMTDSLGIACFLWAYCYGYKSRLAKVAGYAAGILFCPVLLLGLCLETAWSAWKNASSAEDGSREGQEACTDTGLDASVLLWTVTVAAVLAGILGAVNGFGFFSGVLGQVNFLTFEALTGASFNDGISWMLSQLWLLCLPVSVWGIYKLISR